MDNSNDFLSNTNNEDETNENININTQQKNMNINDTTIKITETEQEAILNILIKYPNLFSLPVEIPYENDNPDIFIFLKHNHIFNITINKEHLLIHLNEKYKNKLAEYTITFLKSQVKINK